jgi:glyoxylase-like metal-dependent hydrolase (beta-lactamase superfamily II)
MKRHPDGAVTKTQAVIVPVTPFQQNCTVLWCEASKRAVVIDPGGDLPDIERAIAAAGVVVDNLAHPRPRRSRRWCRRLEGAA